MESMPSRLLIRMAFFGKRVRAEDEDRGQMKIGDRLPFHFL
jgi:hypothetical protein